MTGGLRIRFICGFDSTNCSLALLTRGGFSDLLLLLPPLLLLLLPVLGGASMFRPMVQNAGDQPRR